MRKAFPDGGGKLIPIRYCPVSFIWNSQNDFQEAKLNVIDWPGNSPYLNPIEKLWSIRKSRLQKFDCTTMTNLIEAIIQVWHSGVAESEVKCLTPTPTFRKVPLQLRPFQNFRSLLLNIMWMTFGGQEFCSNYHSVEIVVHSKNYLFKQKFHMKLYRFNRNSQLRSIGVGQKIRPLLWR